jgi:aspartyl-tRNA(Asn)/glutamyl-tRNA(Gln) amidotransferase subunit A
MKTQTPLTIKETQELILSNKASISEITREYLQNIKVNNKNLNIFLTVSEDEALTDAKHYDDMIEREGIQSVSEKHPLYGVTIAHKDIFLTQGIRTTAGSDVLTNYIPQYSSTVVQRVSQAGGITIGKVNCDAWAHGSSGENSQFGPTKNPWNTDYVPGGSSSGSGAVLAANMALVSTGTDTCGSTRLPANYCGLVGLKPTYGVISRYGVIAMASSLDTVGPMAHTIDDVELLFNCMQGTDGQDATVVDIPNSAQKTKEKYTIGIPKEFFGEGISPDIAKTIEEAQEELEKVGVTFKEISLPKTKYGISVYYIIQPAEVSSNLGRYDGVRFGEQRSSFGSEAKRRILLGTYVLSAGYYDAFYLKAMQVRTLIRQEVSAAFETVDAIIAPVCPTPPFKIGEKADDPLQMYLTDIYAATANLAGIPSLAIPSGFTQNGLPLGFQLMGPKFSEYQLFELGRRFHQQIGWKPTVANL